MPEIQETAPLFISDPERTARLVLETYRSAGPRDAFETAVRAYRQRNPNVAATLARRAVARIICGRDKHPHSRSRSIATSGGSAGGIG